MSAGSTTRRPRYGRLIAPLVLILFVVGWYQFSSVYIQGANNQLVASGNLAVYVPVQQVSGYLAALLDATYATVVIGLLIFAYNLFRFRRSASSA
ncbi:MAG: hypothetical protein OK456_01470 [Thaumarchaeota archaeon]|nr:hypothetical protein [Nitrososphaerota archaeon]